MLGLGMGKLFRHLALFLACLAFAFVIVVVVGAWEFAAPDGRLSASFAGAQDFWGAVGLVIEAPARLLYLPQSGPGFLMLLALWAALLHGCCYVAFVSVRRIIRYSTSRVSCGRGRLKPEHQRGTSLGE
jgi:hypothetical protein